MWLAIVLRTFLPIAGQYGVIIEQESRRYNLDPLLVAAVIYKESKFRRGVCYKGSHGLMQIQLRPRSCRLSRAEAVKRGLYNPRRNIRRGVKLMAWWRDWWRKHHKDDGYHWLLHYNQGFGKCLRPRCAKRERIPVRTGKIGGYAERVLKIYDKLKKIRDGLSTPAATRGDDRGGV